VLLVQSLSIPPYERAVDGFRQIMTAPVSVILVNEMKRDQVVAEVRQQRPQVIVAVGTDALNKVARIRDVPIVYLMVLNPEAAMAQNNNITGVNMMVAPSFQLAAIRRQLPEASRIGIIVGHGRLASLQREIHPVARELHFEIVAREIRSPQEIPSALASLSGRVDLLWLIPDPEVVTLETIEFLMLFSPQNRVPIVTFSERHLSLGAFLAIEPEPMEMGRQAAEISLKLLAGYTPRNIVCTNAREGQLHLNQRVAKKLGLSGDEGSMNRVR
jgi:putative ABC transport system substrate-binding protein